LVTPWYGRAMATTKKVTITLPAELLETMKSHTDNVSGYLTELVERAERRRLLRAELDSYQGEFGAFTSEELAEAQALLHGGESAERAA
jgi:post-segregation antitoxin (ccd killing protein)